MWYIQTEETKKELEEHNARVRERNKQKQIYDKIAWITLLAVPAVLIVGGLAVCVTAFDDNASVEKLSTSD